MLFLRLIVIVDEKEEVWAAVLVTRGGSDGGGAISANGSVARVFQNVCSVLRW